MLKKPNCPVIALGRALLGRRTGEDLYRAGRRARGRGAKAPVRSRRAASEGDGRGRHRHPGAVAWRAIDAEAAQGHRCRPGAAGQRPPAQTIQAHPTRFAGFAALPTADPHAAADELERAVDQARLQGRDDARPAGRRSSSTTSASGRSSSAPRSSTCRSTCIPAMPHPAVIDAYYKDYAKDFPQTAARRLGLHGRDRDARDPPGAQRRVRQASEPEVHPRPPGRDACRSCSGASTWHWRGRGRSPSRFRDMFCEPLLRDHQRLLLRPGAAVLHAGARHRPHPVRGRLAVRGECAGHALDGIRAHRDEDKAKIPSGNAKRLLRM